MEIAGLGTGSWTIEQTHFKPLKTSSCDNEGQGIEQLKCFLPEHPESLVLKYIFINTKCPSRALDIYVFVLGRFSSVHEM
jgi:hypothetical protein